MTIRNRLYLNNFSTTLASSISDTATTISLDASPGSFSPAASQYFRFTLSNADGDIEIIETGSTDVSGSGPYTIANITRGVEGTTPIAWNAGDFVEIRETKESLLNDNNLRIAIRNMDVPSDSYVSAQNQTFLGKRTDTDAFVAMRASSIVDAFYDKSASDLVTNADWVNSTDDTLAVSPNPIPTNAMVKAYVDAHSGGGGGSLADGDYGDITVSGSGTVLTLDTPASATLASNDKILFKDTSASDALKYATFSSFQTPWNQDIDVNGKVITNASTSDGVQITTDGSEGLRVTGPKVDFKPAGITANTGATLNLYEGQASGTNKIALKAPNTLSGDYTFQLPNGNGTSGYFLQTDGSGNTSWAAVSVADGDKGDITVSASGATWTIDNDVVTYAKIQNVSATQRILGRNSALAGDIEELTASTVKTMLSLSNVENTALSTWAGSTAITTLGTIATGTWSGTAIGETKGGTGQTTFTQGDILYASASNTLSKLAKNTSSTRYLSNTGASNNPAWAQIDLTNGVTGVLPVANGGTGVSTKTAFKATLSANQTVSSTIVTKVNCNTENYDTGGLYDNATNFRYTPTVAGKYTFTAYLSATTNIANGFCTAYIYKNGVAEARQFAFYNSVATIFAVVTADLDMNGSTDYVEFYGQVSGVTFVGSECKFSGHLVEAT